MTPSERNEQLSSMMLTVATSLPEQFDVLQAMLGHNAYKHDLLHMLQVSTSKPSQSHRLLLLKQCPQN